MSTDDHDLGDVVDLVNEVGEDDAKEIIDIADDHGIDLEQAKEVKNLAEELGVDTDEAAEIQDAL